MLPACPGFSQNSFPIAHDPSGSFLSAKHSLVDDRRGFDLCWRKFHLCLHGGSLHAGPARLSCSSRLWTLRSLWT